MKSTSKNILITIGLLLSLTSLAAGQSLTNTAGAFVDIGFGNRASGMGFAYTGIAEGSDAIMWNPGGIVQSEDIHVSMMYTKQYDLVNYNYASGTMPIKNNQSVGLAVVSSGDDVLRENTIYTTYARQFNRFYIGGTVKFRFNSFGNNALNADDYAVFTEAEIQEGFDRQVYGTGKGLALDLGVLFKATNRLKLGVMIRDAASSFQWDTQVRGDGENNTKGIYGENMPVEVVLGVSYEVLDRLYLSTDLMPSMNEAGEDIIRAGIEKKILGVFYLRGGTEQKLQSHEIDHYMMGFGLEAPEIGGVQVSAQYTYVMNELMNSHRMGIQIRL